MTSSPDATPPGGEVIVHVFGRTDVGRTREHNEDAFVVVDLTADNPSLHPQPRTHRMGPKGTLFMVADGMGGAAAGEIASAMAVDAVLGAMRSIWIPQQTTTSETFVRAIKQATKAANEKINSYAAAHPEYRGMGTTATVAGLFGDTLYLAQVGDSRAYVVRNGIAQQITKDQSLMQKLIEAGELTEEQAEHSERRNIILQALGPEPTIKVDLTHQAVRRGDTLVLCSDGLSGQVSKDEIAAIVTSESDLATASLRLIERANEAGGPDNITVIVARFEGAGLRTVADEDEVGHRVFKLAETGQTPIRPAEPRIDPNTPTQPIPVVKRPRAIGQPPSDPVDGASPPPPVPPGTPVVSRARRNAGRLIAVALLAALVAASVWFGYRRFLPPPTPDSTAPPK